MGNVIDQVRRKHRFIEDFDFCDYVTGEEERFDIKGKKKITILYLPKEWGNDKTPIANACPQIMNVDLLECTEKKLVLNMEYVIISRQDMSYGDYENEAPFSCEAEYDLKSGSLKIKDEDFNGNLDEYCMVRNGKITVFLALCRRYFEYVAQSIREELKILRTGWKKDGSKREFVPVTQDEFWRERNDDILNGLTLENGKCFSRFGGGYHKCNQNELIEKTKGFSLFFDCLEMNPSVIGIFSYTLYAILLNYIFGDKSTLFPDTVFAINIYGSKDKRAVANLFSNMFYVNMKKNPRGRGVHEVSVSSVKSKYANYADYASIPIVFSSKTSLNRNSRIVKRLQGYRESGKIYCFPVFITETAMNADEILDFKVDRYVIKEIGEENLTEMKNEISYLLLSFIHFLSRISDANSRGPVGDGSNDFAAFHEVEDAFCDVGEAIKKSGEPARLELSYYQWLNASIKTFRYFLSAELSLAEQACRLKERAKAFFSSAEVELSDYESKSETEEEALLRFGEYIEALFSDGNGEEPYFHYMKRDTGRIYKGGECYYLGYREFFQDFQTYDQKKTHISEERLKVLLKDKDLLVMRPDGRQYGVERGFGNGKRTVLVIKKEPFDELCGLGASQVISEPSVQ